MLYAFYNRLSNLHSLQQNLQRGGGNVPGMNGGPGILNDVQSDPQQGNLPKQPEIITISFDKAKGTKGPAIGLSIVAAKVRVLVHAIY